MTGLVNGRTYGILLQAVAGSQTYCFESLVFATLFDVSIPLITGFDAWKSWDDGAQEVTLFWDDPDDDTLTYEYWYEGVPAHWSSFPGTGRKSVSGTPPAEGWDGTLYTTVGELPCEAYYLNFWIRPRRGGTLGPVVRTNYVYMSDHVYPGEDTLHGDRDHECLSGWDGNDKVYGNRGNDILKGHRGNDLLNGGPGNDQLDGGPGDDQLNGEDGDDRLEGGPGADRLDGGPGIDTVYYSGPYASVDLTVTSNGRFTTSGGHGQGDTLINVERFAGLAIALFLEGDDGDNVLRGHDGDDTLRGFAGNDFLIGSPGSDTLDGGPDTDTADYAGSGTAVSVNLATGNHSGGYAQGDTLISIENLIGSSHNDNLTGDANANNIKGGPGCDTLNGGPGDDTLIGNDGCDTLNGNDGNDMLFGNDGVDTLNGNNGNDILDGGADADALDGGADTDTARYVDSNAAVTVSLTSGTGSGGHAQGDTLTLIENLIGSSFGDILTGDNLANSLRGEAGNDTLVGRAGADALDGGANTDTASYAGATAAVTVNLATGTHTGEAQGDTFTSIEIISGSAHNDTLTGNASANHLKGEAGNDTLVGLAGADTLDGGGGTGDTASYAGSNAAVTVNLNRTGAQSGGHAQGDTLTAIENLIGSSLADTLTGDANANSLRGEAGNDTLVGRAGADALDGGANTDTASYAGAPAAVTVNLATGTHTGEAQGDTFTSIEIISGSAHNDTLTGNASANHLKGEAGNDTLVGLAGADTLDGGVNTDTASYAGSSAAVTVSLTSGTGSGGHAQGDTLTLIENLIGSSLADTLTGDANANSLRGEAGNDTLVGRAGADALDGGANTDTASYAGAPAAVTVNLATGTHTGEAQGDTFTSIEIISGSAHNDTLTGNASANHLKGEAGNDTLVGLAGADTLDGGVNTDTASYAGSSAAVTVSLTSGTGSGGHAQGDTLTLIENLIGSSLADTLTGDANANSLRGEAGNDTLVGRAGADALDGGANTDTASYAGAPAAVTVNLTTGTHTGEAQGDTFTSIEIISGSGHNDTLTGNASANHLKGEAGNDTLVGLGGADTLDGGPGTGDTASYAGSNNAVTVSLTSGTGSGGHAQGDTLTLIENLIGSSLADTLTGDVNANSLRGTGGNDTLIGRAGADALDGGGGTDTASYASSNAAVSVNLNSTGTQSGGHAQGDTLTLIENLIGSNFGDTLTGDVNANSLRGEAGNDTLIGRAGADALDGGGGTDTASYAGATAAVTVNLTTGTHTGEAQGDTFTSIEIISGSGHNDTLTGNASANSLRGTGGNDTLIGRAGADALDGGGGTDTASYAGATAAVTVNLTTGTHTGEAQGDTFTSIEIISGSGHNDTLTGNASANHLKGEAGNDTLVGLGGADTLDGGPGTGDTASYAGSNNAVTVSLTSGTGSGGHAQGDTLTAIENLIGSSLADTLTGDVNANSLRGTGGNDTLIGRAGADALDGGGGTDTASYAGATAAVTVNLTTGTHTGEAQGDTFTSIEIISGSGHNDTLTGNASANHLKGEAGNDTLVGLGGADTLDGGPGTGDTASYAGSNTAVSVNLDGSSGSGGHAQGDTLTAIENLTGSSHADTLSGNASANHLKGEAGDDTLWGGPGADTLDGGDGPGDTARYVSSDAGVTVNLDTETGSGGHAQGDTLTNIENVGGSAFDDVLTGNSENNILQSFGGHDTLVGLEGADEMDGGIGTDTADYSGSNAGVTVNLDTGTGSGGHAQGDTLTRIENLIGSDHDDTLTGNSFTNILRGGAGGDALNGGGRMDTADYSGSNAAVTVNLNTGTHSGGHAQGDTLTSIENLIGSDHDDTLTGNGSANVLTGGDGDDTLVGRQGDDTLNGHDGDDSLGGHSGDDTLNGHDGDDLMIGGSGADSFDGGEGTDAVHYTGSGAVTVNLATRTGSGGHAQGDTFTSIENLTGSGQGDTLIGDDKNNSLSGAAGNDTLIGNAGADALDGGSGTDTASYDGSNAGVTVSLVAGVTGSGGHAQGDTLTEIENLIGSAHGDTLTGDANANALTGAAGNDTLNSGGGDDMLNGGTGTDALTGGGGSDEFYFHADFSNDTIADYTLGTSKADSEEIHLCMGTQTNPPTHSGADSGSNHVITVTFDGSTAGTITLTGITTSSTNFANLNIIIAASTGTACAH